MINIYKSYIPVQYMYKSMEVKVLKKHTFLFNTIKPCIHEVNAECKTFKFLS